MNGAGIILRNGKPKNRDTIKNSGQSGQNYIAPGNVNIIFLERRRDNIRNGRNGCARAMSRQNN